MEIPESKIQVQLPVKLEYSVLSKFLQQKLQGEIISSTDEKGAETKYAEILKIDITHSREPEFDLNVQLRIRTLTSLFRNQVFDIGLQAAVEYNAVRQELYVTSFELDSDSGNWFLNKFIGSLANSFLYKSFLNKMRYDFRPVLEENHLLLNNMLEKRLEVHKGIFINGAVREIRIDQVLPGQRFLLIAMNLSGSALAEVKSIDF